MKEYKVTWYVMYLNEPPVQGRTLVKEENEEYAMWRVILEKSREMYIHPKYIGIEKVEER